MPLIFMVVGIRIMVFLKVAVGIFLFPLEEKKGSLVVDEQQLKDKEKLSNIRPSEVLK
jgi:hypothetical protein